MKPTDHIIDGVVIKSIIEGLAEGGLLIEYPRAGDCAPCFANGFLTERCAVLNTAGQVSEVMCPYCGAIESLPSLITVRADAKRIVWPLPLQRKVGTIRNYTATQEVEADPADVALRRIQEGIEAERAADRVHVAYLMRHQTRMVMAAVLGIGVILGIIMIGATVALILTR